MCGAAAATDCPATAMEHAAFHFMLLGQSGDFLLRLEQIPAGSENTAVLAGIRIAQHHFLQIARVCQQTPVNRVFQQRRHDRFDMAQVFNGFK